jgi:[protein-PII] uridylyltransferase
MKAEAVAFRTSMPAAYRTAFDDESVVQHAAIVARRGGRGCWVEAWRELAGRTLALCIVADDEPGLASRISAALAAAELDVVDAHAYGRTLPSGRVEAVDFFWVRRRDERGEPVALRAAEVEEVQVAIEAILGGRPAPLPRRRTLPPESDAAPGSVRVRFERSARDGGVVLTVLAPDRPGLLLALTGALFRADVQIVALRATSENGVVSDRFELAEIDGNSLSEERVRSLQPVVFEAIASTIAT